LRENVALSNIDCVQQDTAIWDACEKSHLTDLISTWEKGIDEQLTRYFDPNGKELSGGQWQRVSLARAFFGNGSIALLDEPSAALDPFVEHEIFEQFSRISCGKSAILILHRLSSITMCDTILVLDGGHIIEQGTHAELLNRKGKYAQLFNLQAEKYDDVW
jgi:ATP-binding cassette subfamily B protein